MGNVEMSIKKYFSVAICSILLFSHVEVKPMDQAVNNKDLANAVLFLGAAGMFLYVGKGIFSFFFPVTRNKRGNVTEVTGNGNSTTSVNSDESNNRITIKGNDNKTCNISGNNSDVSNENASSYLNNLHPNVYERASDNQLAAAALLMGTGLLSSGSAYYLFGGNVTPLTLVTTFTALATYCGKGEWKPKVITNGGTPNKNKGDGARNVNNGDTSYHIIGQTFGGASDKKSSITLQAASGSVWYPLTNKHITGLVLGCHCKVQFCQDSENEGYRISGSDAYQKELHVESTLDVEGTRFLRFLLPSHVVTTQQDILQIYLKNLVEIVAYSGADVELKTKLNIPKSLTLDFAGNAQLICNNLPAIIRRGSSVAPTFIVQDLILYAKERSIINLVGLQAGKITVEGSSTSIVTLDGTVAEAKVTYKDYAKLHASKLEVKKMNVDAFGSSELNVKIAEYGEISGKVVSPASVFYENLNQNITDHLLTEGKS